MATTSDAAPCGAKSSATRGAATAARRTMARATIAREVSGTPRLPSPAQRLDGAMEERDEYERADRGRGQTAEHDDGDAAAQLDAGPSRRGQRQHRQHGRDRGHEHRP